MKKSLLLILVLILSISVVATFSFIGCKTEKVEESTTETEETIEEAQAEEETVEVEKKVITFWNGFTGPDRPVLEELVKRFNESNDGIEVKLDIMPWENLYQKFGTAVASGEGPDIVAFNTENIGTYAIPGAIVPIDDLYEDNIVDLNVIPKGLADNLVYKGKYYGCPVNFATLMLYYNKDLFKEAGIDPENPPKNWDELIDYALKLTKESDGNVEQYGFGIATKMTIPMWPILIWGNGGDYIDYENMKSLMNSEKTIEAVEIFSDLILNNHISPPILTGAEVDKLFMTQKSAMLMNGPWMVNGFKDAGLNFGVAPVPAGPEREVTLGTGVAMYLTKNSVNKEEVYEFFKFWNSKESQIYWALQNGFPPARTDLTDDSALQENPYVVAFASVANNSQFYLQQLTNFAMIDNDVIVPAMEAILLGELSVKDAFDKATSDMNEMLME